ncbi:MAG: hypothetical protein WCG06_03180 [Candidatus Omnitrophota bacterium]
MTRGFGGAICLFAFALGLQLCAPRQAAASAGAVNAAKSKKMRRGAAAQGMAPQMPRRTQASAAGGYGVPKNATTRPAQPITTTARPTAAAAYAAPSRGYAEGPLPPRGPFVSSAAGGSTAPSAQLVAASHGGGYSATSYGAAPATTLKVSEYQFLIAFGRNVAKSNAGLTNRIYGVIDQLKISPRLTKENYDFFIKLSRSIGNPEISQRIYLIAEEHQPA